MYRYFKSWEWMKVKDWEGSESTASCSGATLKHRKHVNIQSKGPAKEAEKEQPVWQEENQNCVMSQKL